MKRRYRGRTVVSKSRLRCCAMSCPTKSPPRQVLFTNCAAPVPILTYHQIQAPPPRGTPYRSLNVAPDVFRRHMRWLAALGYRGLSIRDLMPYLSGERTGKVFGLTFDDGFQNVLIHAQPVLQDLGYTATNYVVAGHPGRLNFWDADKGVPVSRLMNRHEIVEWANAGNEIGAHTVDHADLSRLRHGIAHAQIWRSRILLEDLTGGPVQAFSYPYGAYLAEHVEMARLAGFTSATTTNRGRVRTGMDFWQLPRISVVRSTNFLVLAQKIFTTYEDRRRGVRR